MGGRGGDRHGREQCENFFTIFQIATGQFADDKRVRDPPENRRISRVSAREGRRPPPSVPGFSAESSFQS